MPHPDARITKPPRPIEDAVDVTPIEHQLVHAIDSLGETDPAMANYFNAVLENMLVPDTRDGKDGEDMYIPNRFYKTSRIILEDVTDRVKEATTT